MNAFGEKVTSVIGAWSLKPPDLPAKVAAFLAVLLFAAAFFKRGASLIFGISDPRDEEAWSRERRRFLAATALIAALLSVAYVSFYLRGGPRIIDATTYFLQGRALSHGDLAWPVDPAMSASFRGRFLIYRESPTEGGLLGGVFPPGYPLLLAFGFLLGSPMLIGPLTAAAIVVATYRLARILATDIFAVALHEPIARTAAIVSVFCATLRYHTADTMSHGASALAITLALGSAIRARREENTARHAIVAGLLVGYVVATRPASALPIGLVMLFLLLKNFRQLLPSVIAVVPGALLLLASQQAVTGSWWTSTQRMYYATSDGPANCFRYGFGKTVGCVFEHGDFVEARLQSGYGFVEALGTTLRRLRPHLLDIANLELLAPLIVLPIVRRRSHVGLIAATSLIALQILAYAPFYFDGSYPGGGARFFADILPVEHVLLVLAVTFIATRAGPAKYVRDFTRGAFTLFALMMLGFFVHAVHEHVKLRDRDGGPMFEPDVLAHASLTSGLVFVDTDHGFGLGNDPAATTGRTSSAKRLVVARLKNDARDRMLFDALDRPPTYLYRFDPGAIPPTKPTLTPWAPAEHDPTMKLEGESEWPPVGQDGGGIAIPGWVSSCASNRRALVIAPNAKTGKETVTINLPVPSPGRYTVAIHLVDGAAVPYANHRAFLHSRGEGRITIDQEVWTFGPLTPRTTGDCWSLATKDLDLRSSFVRVTLEAIGGTLALDYIGLKKVP